MGARLHVLLARDARVGVIFRRGPSKQVLLARWSLGTDRIELGQWLKGRIYEQRCDLSPSGDLLVYFAANHKPPHVSWTAISRPPYLTALALFPKGDGWGGGGLFESETRLRLNHRPPDEMKLAGGFRLPKRFVVEPFGDHSGWGEDDPIRHERLLRDGWRLVTFGTERRRSAALSPWVLFDPPRTYARPHPRKPGLSLERRTTGLKETNGPWEVVEHRLVHESKGTVLDLGPSDWADWDPKKGDLLFARGGCLHRAHVLSGHELAAPRLVADLRGETFRELRAPARALRW